MRSPEDGGLFGRDLSDRDLLTEAALLKTFTLVNSFGNKNYF